MHCPVEHAQQHRPERYWEAMRVFVDLPIRRVIGAEVNPLFARVVVQMTNEPAGGWLKVRTNERR